MVFHNVFTKGSKLIKFHTANTKIDLECSFCTNIT